MKTNKKLILTTAIFFALGAAAGGCQTKTESKSIAVNQPAAPPVNIAEQTANTKAKTDKNTKIETEMETEKPTGNSLASPTESYKTLFALRKEKDFNGLKKALSKTMLDFLAEMAKSENKTLDDQLKELVAQPQAAVAESRGERIVGDLAALEYLEEDGKWQLMGFVKEGGDWKMTIPDSKISAIWDAPR